MLHRIVPILEKVSALAERPVQRCDSLVSQSGSLITYAPPAERDASELPPRPGKQADSEQCKDPSRRTVDERHHQCQGEGTDHQGGDHSWPSAHYGVRPDLSLSLDVRGEFIDKLTRLRHQLRVRRDGAVPARDAQRDVTRKALSGGGDEALCSLLQIRPDGPQGHPASRLAKPHFVWLKDGLIEECHECDRGGVGTH